MTHTSPRNHCTRRAGGQIPLGMTHGEPENTLGSNNKDRKHQTALLFHAGGFSFHCLHFYLLLFSVQSLAPLTGCSDLPGLQCPAQMLKHPLHPPVSYGVFRAHLSTMQRSMSPFASLGSAHSAIFPFCHDSLNTWGFVCTEVVSSSIQNVTITDCLG